MERVERLWGSRAAEVGAHGQRRGPEWRDRAVLRGREQRRGEERAVLQLQLRLKTCSRPGSCAHRQAAREYADGMKYVWENVHADEVRPTPLPPSTRTSVFAEGNLGNLRSLLSFQHAEQTSNTNKCLGVGRGGPDTAGM